MDGGAAKETKGAIKETGGNAIGDAKLTAEGKSDKAEARSTTPLVA